VSVQTWTKRRGTWLGSLAGAVLLLGGVAASHASGASSGQADRIRAVERARLHALVTADTATAKRLIADDFELINPAGAPSGRDDYLAAVAAGDIDYLAFEPTSPIDVRLHGNVAALRFQVHFDLVLGGALHVTHEGWVTELYERHGGDWQIVWEQATAVPNNFDAFVQALLPPP
jgi:Domain of unknown function (DUF4440)